MPPQRRLFTAHVSTHEAAPDRSGVSRVSSLQGRQRVMHPLVSRLLSQAAARHQCLYLVQQHSAGFLEAGGEESWLSGLEQAPGKLRSLQTLNKLLAHRPWLITQQHIQVRPRPPPPPLRPAA